MKQLNENAVKLLRQLREDTIKANDNDSSETSRRLRIVYLNNVQRLTYELNGLSYYPYYNTPSHIDIIAETYPCTGCIFMQDGQCNRTNEMNEKVDEKYTERCYDQPDGEHGETIVWKKVPFRPIKGVDSHTM